MPKALSGATKRGGRRMPSSGSRKIPGTPRRIGGFLSSVPRQPTSGQFRNAHRGQVRDTSGRFAGGWGYAWVGVEAAVNRINEFNDEVHEALNDAAESLANDMVAYAQANASWIDHPGVHEDARENLQSEVVWNDAENVTILLGHGKDVYYGIWLEVRWGGRYAILLPTLEQFAPQLGGRVKAFF